MKPQFYPAMAFLSLGLCTAIGPSNAATARMNKAYETTCTSCGLQTNNVTLGAELVSTTQFRFISRNPNDPSFVGNDVEGRLVFTGPGAGDRVITGVVSRTIKSGSNQLAVYMAEKDANFSNLTGKAYVLVIPGNENQLQTGSNYGSASDPMDQVLNSPVLPALGLMLKASRQQDGALLQWSVLSEQRTATYILERSLDARTYTQAGTLTAAGYSQQARQYQLADKPNSQKAVYYRVRLVDADGRQQLSNIASVSFAPARGGFSLYPNPARGFAHLWLPEAGTYTVRVTNSQGAALYSRTIQAEAGGTSTNVLSSQMAAGIYRVQVTHAQSGKSQSQWLTVQ